MTETLSLQINANQFSESFSQVGAEFERVASEQIIPAASLIEDAFAVAATSIQSSLSRAAERGELSLKKLTRALAKDLRRFAIDAFVRQPVHNLVSNVLTAPFGGGRAAGGFAAAGQSFLVGERGPELFTPAQNGNVRTLNASGVTVNISLPGVSDVESFRRSETQLAAALARALGRGQRNL